MCIGSIAGTSEDAGTSGSTKNHLHPFGQRLLQSVQCIIDYETKCHPHNPYILLWHRFWAFGHRSHKPYEFLAWFQNPQKEQALGRCHEAQWDEGHQAPSMQLQLHWPMETSHVQAYKPLCHEIGIQDRMMHLHEGGNTKQIAKHLDTSFQSPIAIQQKWQVLHSGWTWTFLHLWFWQNPIDQANNGVQETLFQRQVPNVFFPHCLSRMRTWQLQHASMLEARVLPAKITTWQSLGTSSFRAPRQSCGDNVMELSSPATNCFRWQLSRFLRQHLNGQWYRSLVSGPQNAWDLMPVGMLLLKLLDKLAKLLRNDLEQSRQHALFLLKTWRQSNGRMPTVVQKLQAPQDQALHWQLSYFWPFCYKVWLYCKHHMWTISENESSCDQTEGEQETHVPRMQDRLAFPDLLGSTAGSTDKTSGTSTGSAAGSEGGKTSMTLLPGNCSAGIPGMTVKLLLKNGTCWVTLDA